MNASLTRADILDQQFIRCVQEGYFPAARSDTHPESVGLSPNAFLELFDSQIISRHLDLQARLLKERGQSYYTIGSSGHEGNAAVARAFDLKDMAFLHYRSGAFMIERAKQTDTVDPIRDILLSLVASKHDPIASGRHKVFGSVPLNIPPQTSTIASHLPKAVGAAMSLHKIKALGVSSTLASDAVILCSFGDASVNHSTAQGAFNFARWLSYTQIPLPIVFICEDNDIGISVPTPKGWIETVFENTPGLHYLFADGLNLADVYRASKHAEQIARKNKKPVFLHLKMVRLLGHAGSDVETQYHTEQQIAETEFQDPLLHTARKILEQGYLTAEQIIERYEFFRKQVADVAITVLSEPKLKNAEEVMEHLIPNRGYPKPSFPNEEERLALLGSDAKQLSLPRNLAQQINLALFDILLQYPNAVVFGEDVAKKGGVYHVTAGLFEKFGAHQVFNSLLDEQSILGGAIGMAQAGLLPIPEIQFLAYVHNAQDQIRGEAATLSFFSNAQYTNPMVVRIPGFAYQKGFGGHFHNDNSIAMLRDIPGVIIAVPSNGVDAAKMLRTCVALAHEQGRVVLFIEPIALYMTRDLHVAGDQLWLGNYSAPHETISLGEIGVWGDPASTVILSYGNGYYLSRQAAEILKIQHHLSVQVIDLRWLSPLPTEALIHALSQAKNILIVDECRHTGSLSEGLLSWIYETLHPTPNIRRITAKDSFIPLGEAWQYVLPRVVDIIAFATSFAAV